MKLLDGMNYRQWQRRNTEKFKSLTKAKQKEARQKGYYNLGWDKVKKSWKILSSFNNVISLFEHQLQQGKIVDAIDTAILESENAKRIAQEGKTELTKIQKHLDQVADKVLAKHPLL